MNKAIYLLRLLPTGMCSRLRHNTTGCSDGPYMICPVQSIVTEFVLYWAGYAATVMRCYCAVLLVIAADPLVYLIDLHVGQNPNSGAAYQTSYTHIPAAHIGPNNSSAGSSGISSFINRNHPGLVAAALLISSAVLV